MDLEYPTRPFGDVTRGLLVLRARLRPLAHSPLAPHVVDIENTTTHGLSPRLNLYPDTLDDKNLIEVDLVRAEFGRGPLLLICLWLDRNRAEGLIVAPSAIDNDAHSRIGIFRAMWPFSELSGPMFSDCKV